MSAMAGGELSELEAVLGYSFGEPDLLEQALRHGSIRHEQQTSGHAPGESPVAADNERLEFLGDAIVGLVVAEMLYRRYPELDEGELTRLRAALVSRRHLGQVGTGLGLGRYLLLGKAEERSGGRKKTVLLANCVEALVGALYLDGGLAAAASFIERVVAAPSIDALHDELRARRAIGDYKSALQELLQSRHGGQPRYVLKEESGPDHRKRFAVEVEVGQVGARAPEFRPRGEGTTKKNAEQEAARLAYELLIAPPTGRPGKGLSLDRELDSKADAGPNSPSVSMPAASTPNETALAPTRSEDLRGTLAIPAVPATRRTARGQVNEAALPLVGARARPSGPNRPASAANREGTR